jgi:acetoacetyl-CoA synthetase
VTEIVEIPPGCAAEIQDKALGMAVNVSDGMRDEPASVANQGLEGKHIYRQPFPSQPLGFYGSDGPIRYRKAYFKKYGDSIWRQGDSMRILLDTTGIIIYS